METGYPSPRPSRGVSVTASNLPDVPAHSGGPDFTLEASA